MWLSQSMEGLLSTGPTLSNFYNFTLPYAGFSKNRPLVRFFHRVAMSIYMFVPFSCNFCRGLSLALRSHDQIPAIN